MALLARRYEMPNLARFGRPQGVRFGMAQAILLLGLLAGHAARAEEAGRPGFDPLGGPAPSAECARGYELLLVGELAESRMALWAAVAKAPGEAPADFALGLLAQLDGRRQDALESFSRALSTGLQDPWAELYLRSGATQLEGCRDPQPFLAALKALEGQAGVRPYLKDLACYLRAAWLNQSGAYREAADVAAPLQYLNQWALIGPFDNRDKSGFDKPYPPEEEIDFERPAGGRNRPVSWFRPTVQPVVSRIDLLEIFEPNTHSLAYAVTHVKVEAAQWAVLRVGAAGAAKVWVNEREAAKIAGYNGFAPEKVAVPVYLYQGWNQVLVKSAVAEGDAWAFAVRFSRPEGGAVAGLAMDSSAAALKAYRAESAGRTAPLLVPAGLELGLLPRVEAALKAHPEDPWLRWCQGRVLELTRQGSREDRLAAAEYQKASARCPRCPVFRMQLATLDGDINEARQAAENCQASHPELALPLAVLAQLAHRSELDVETEGYARAALAKFGPGRAAPCAALLADVLAGRSEGPEAERLLEGFVSVCPYRAEGWLLLAHLRPSRRERRETLERGLGFCGGSAGLRLRWAAELAERGQDREAAEFLEAGLPARPFAISERLGAARAWHNAGDANRERALLDQARAIAPENPALLTVLGTAELLAGRSDEAAALWREVLRVKPDSPRVKDWLAEASKGAAVDKGFFAAYDVSYRDLRLPKEGDYPGDNSVTLLNQEVVHVNPNGSASRMVHLVAKLLRPDGAADLRRHQIYYEPSRQVVDILRAAVITPDGREMSRAEVSDRTVSAALGVETRIYDEYHLKVVLFRDLEPGALIDLQYIQRDTGGNIYGDFFAGFFQLGDDQPVVKSQYVLDLPKSREFQMRSFRQGLAPKRLDSKDPNREVFEWESRDFPGVLQERLMSPLGDELPFVQVTTLKTWQEAGAWYWNLAKDSVVADEELRKAVAEITRDAKTPLEKLRAIHDWVVKKVRYLGIEFGRNGYRPHRATETFKAYYGDCKDTAALVVAMLQAAGIDARLALVRAVTSGKIESDALPAPNLFNHCIAYVPDVEGQDYWVDGTTDYHQLGEVPYTDQGAQALVAGPDGGRFMQIPKATAEENRSEEHVRARVDQSGGGTVQARHVYRGQFAPYYRELAETPGRYKSQLQEQTARRFAGAELTRINYAAPGEQGPMWLETEFKAPTLAAQSGDRRALFSTLQPLELARRYLTGAERHHDLELWFPWARTSEIVYELDAVWSAVGLPEPAELKEDFGRFTRQVTAEGQTVRIRDDFVLAHQRIALAEYAKFGEFCRKVDALLDEKVLLQGK